MTTLEILLLIVSVLSIVGNLYLFALLTQTRTYLRRAIQVAEKAAQEFNAIQELAKKLAFGGAFLVAIFLLKKMTAEDSEDDSES